MSAANFEEWKMKDEVTTIDGAIHYNVSPLSAGPDWLEWWQRMLFIMLIPTLCFTEDYCAVNITITSDGSYHT